MLKLFSFSTLKNIEIYLLGFILNKLTILFLLSISCNSALIKNFKYERSCELKERSHLNAIGIRPIETISH